MLVCIDYVIRYKEESYFFFFYRLFEKFVLYLNKGKNKIGYFYLGSFWFMVNFF